MAQTTVDEEAAIARVAGVSDVSELDADEYERYEALLRRPAAINRWGEVRLEETGLFSAYQLAAIGDYRIRHGDLLSAMELAQVDGFSKERATALRPFLDFSPRAPDRGTRLSGEAVWKPQKWKAHIGLGQALAFSYSPTGSRNLSIGGWRGQGWQLTVGDYRARFGQGLLLWSGFSIAGVTALGGFARSGASGVSPAHSWSQGTALRGAAGQLRLGRWRLSAFSEGGYRRDLPLLLGGNATLLLRNGQWGVTGYRREVQPAKDGKPAQNGELKLSTDFFYNWRGIELYGELAWDALPDCVAGVGGVRFRMGDEMRMALMVRYYPSDYQSVNAAAIRAGSRVSDEAGAALGWEWTPGRKVKAVVTADAARMGLSGEKQKRQLKLFGQLSWQWNPNWRLEIRGSERLRSGAYTGSNGRARSELRAELQWGSGSWRSSLRLDGEHCLKNGFLAYWEQGFDDTRWRLYLRETFFAADNWADRIYAYERDAPGGFSVPAFYGRGVKYGLLAGRKVRFLRHFRLSLYARASLKIYPFRGYRKAAQAEGKLQLQLTF